MLSRHQETSGGEARYDAATLRKVTALAAELQNRHGETLTAGEIEAAGSEVGLEPVFIRQALAQLHARQQPVTRPPSPSRLAAMRSAWWSAGWTLPLMGAPLAGEFGEMLVPLVFFGSLALYIGLGCFLSHMSGEAAKEASRSDAGADGGALSRAALLDLLFTIQGRLASSRERRTFLSVDVAGSSAMKAGADELAVEYSFGKLREWIEQVVREHGGALHSAAGDGMMCVFPADADAVRAARRLQEGVARFNASANRLPAPFRLRCGINAGAVAHEEGVPVGHLHSAVIDHAAALQKRAAPGDIVVAQEVSAAALGELGSLSRLPDAVDGVTAFSWRGAAP